MVGAIRGVRRYPRRDKTEAEAAPHGRRSPDGGAHQRPELGGGETAEHRDDAVVPAHGMEAERPREQPESTGGQPAPPQVADDHATASNPVQLPKKRDRLVVAEVMQELRTEGDVDTAV